METTDAKKKSVQCEVCSKTFSTGTALKVHITSVHEKIKPFICPICGKGLFSKWSLQSHIGRRHSNKEDSTWVNLILNSQIT